MSETCRVDGVGVALGFRRCGYLSELKATTPRWHLKRAAPDIVGYGGRARFTTCAVQRAEKWRRGGWLGLKRFDVGGARSPVGARRRAELKRCGSAAARFQAIRGLGYRALRVGLICGISYVYSSPRCDSA